MIIYMYMCVCDVYAIESCDSNGVREQLHESLSVGCLLKRHMFFVHVDSENHWLPSMPYLKY